MDAPHIQFPYSNISLLEPPSTQQVPQPREHSHAQKQRELREALPKLRVNRQSARIENGTDGGNMVQTAEDSRGSQRVLWLRGCPPGVVRGQDAQTEAERHGLPVVEFGMGRPAGVQDVGCAPVGDVATDGRDECGDGQAEATRGDWWTRHAVGRYLLECEVTTTTIKRKRQDPSLVIFLVRNSGLHTALACLD